MANDASWIDAYHRDGHATVESVFSAAEMDAAVADIEAWGAETLAGMSEDERYWYIDGGVKTATVLRKLDLPHHRRDVFRDLARHPKLVGLVEELIGSGVSVTFSQVFMKPPGGGGPKPMHQDNFYFGPRDQQALTTAWIALDAATEENGCLEFCDGSNTGPILDHTAPEDRPFDLQVPTEVARGFPMTKAPVPRGGVSFHHGKTLHQSGDNFSDRPRRACAFHYLRNDNTFTSPAIPYDLSLVMQVT